MSSKVSNLSERATIDNPAQAKPLRSVGTAPTADILNCLANLSSDEVFTSPELANQMLDLLPQELFSNPKTTFLDPCCKSGVFLREIAKRLLKGLENQIPDLQQRIDHIMSKQLYGIALTSLTAEMSRRTLYCAKKANGDYSVATCFKEEQGNLCYMSCEHTWENGKCSCCGANRTQYDRIETSDNYAYPFIHKNINKIFKKMQFDVIIGNPPYQMSCTTENNVTNVSYAKPIYPDFIKRAIDIKPKFIVMIIPSRWMTKSGMVSDDWTNEMIHGNHFEVYHDYLNSTDCFSGVDIMGGVGYFLYATSYKGKCKYYLHDGNNITFREDYLDSIDAGIVIRDPIALGIIEKVVALEGLYHKNTKNNFSHLVCQRDYFTRPNQLTSNWVGFSDIRDSEHTIKYYLNKRMRALGYGWIKPNEVPKHHESVNLHKVYIPKAHGSEDMVLGRPFYGEPGSVCSATYLCIGYDSNCHNFTKEQCNNIISYIQTKFFRYLVTIKKKTQDAPRDVYQFVPMQDFSHPWTDEMLYKKYGLDKDEIAFIESMIKPME